MADESTIRISADASQAVSELTKLRNAITLSYNSLDKAAESFKELKDRQRALKDITKITTKFIGRKLEFGKPQVIQPMAQMQSL